MEDSEKFVEELWATIKQYVIGDPNEIKNAIKEVVEGYVNLGKEFSQDMKEIGKDFKNDIVKEFKKDSQRKNRIKQERSLYKQQKRDYSNIKIDPLQNNLSVANGKSQQPKIKMPKIKVR